jgi:ABC-type polysaccharide/polyol phosphate transport system ATPase subunit
LSRLAVSVQGVGKKFDIGVERQRTVLQQIRYWTRGHNPTRSFWALRDIGFEVEEGQAVGIVGPNGSGKSTLLRIIAGILLPNEGHVESRGRVNPFLALGVSLLPQLTVMENLRVCAALLGYTDREFRAKLDDIVDFSELHDYLYAAVADLSAGWAARVAFSIAVHTDLNILLVDETLEVGDAYFKMKCRAKFREFQKEGKTLLLVSHEMSEVRDNCDKALYISGGRMMMWGDAKSVVSRYEEDVARRMGRS